MDDPDTIVNGAMENHRNMIKQFRGTVIVLEKQKNIYKRETGEKKSPKTSSPELGFLALSLNRTRTQTLTHMTSEKQLPVTAPF